ncbi:MAG: Uma2 family endonuclease [Gemmatimonadota bacterium]
MTADDLERLYLPGKKVELIRGVPVVEELPSSLHGLIANELTYRLTAFVKGGGLGSVFAQDTGFKIWGNPDTVRGADVAFVARERLTDVPRRGYLALAPDLVAEIVSPGDRPGEVLEKVADWLDGGTRLVWVIDPARRHCQIFRQDGTTATLGPEETLDGEDVLPGFSLALDTLLDAGSR